MNISFQNQNNRVETPVAGGYPERAERDRAAHAQEKQKRSVADAANVSFSASEIGFPAFGNAEEKGRDKGKTLADIQQEAAYTDVGISQDYMTVMSHTMSEEDYQKLSEEGFHFASLDPEEAVTIVDRIKAELVKSGKQIIGYTDDLDVDTLAAAVGSEVLARAIADNFRAADIPLTDENIADVSKAWNMAVQLGEPSDGTCQYLIDNGLEPEIWNFYLAQNSGAGSGKNVGGDFLADPNMKQQIDQMLEQNGMEPDAENRQAANWLLERALPLTAENLERLQELQQMSFPVEEETFAAAAAAAVSAGQSAVHADLAAGVAPGTDRNSDEAAPGRKKTNVYEKAVEALDTYRKAYEEALQTGDVSARRQLEEIRLRMTAEVNVKLLKSGFAIDTAPMEELITALREMEQEVAGTYFPNAEDAVARYENWNAVTEVMEELPTMPARLLGTVQLHEAAEGSDASGAQGVSGVQQEATTLSRFHAEGRALKEDYRKAGESYEALMTAPRADLGDSIRKAFSNVDDILRDMGMDVTDENRRAVRILGYNHMNIDRENMDRVLEADATVKQLIQKMTPAATLRMIRDGINPLEQSFAQLGRYFDELPEEYREQAESYSRYLYGLEQSKEITAEERTSYIGVYRLLRQIEKSDGAAVGAVVNVQAEMQFSNLLSAVRSGKFRHMDVKASEEFGTLKELVKKGEALSIDSQISRAYERQRLEETREAVHTDSAVVNMLQRGEISPTAENLLAAQRLLQTDGNPFRTLREKAEKLRSAGNFSGATEAGKAVLNESDGTLATENEEGANAGTHVWERLEDRETFRTEYDAMVSDLQDVAEKMTFGSAQDSIDVRSLQLAHRQLGIMGCLARREEYLLPMYVGEELAAVHLTLERGSTEKGGIAIAVDYAENTHLEAHLQVKNGRVEGFLLGNTPEEVTKLQQASDIFYNLIKENSSLELETAELPVVSKGNIKGTGMSEINSQEEGSSPDNGMLYRVAKLFLQAIR